MKKKENIILAVLLVIIFGYLYYNYFLKIEIGKIADINKKIDEKQTTVRALTERKRNIDIELANTKLKDVGVEQLIPNAFNKKELIRFFYDFVKNSGTEGNQISFSEPKAVKIGKSKKTSYYSMSASLKLQGDYASLRNSLRQLENNNRKFVVKQASIATNYQGLSTLSMSLEFYAMNPK